MAELLEKYWSVELFWFPFNSVVSRFLNILPKNLEDSQLILSLENLFVSHPLKTVRVTLIYCMHMQDYTDTHIILYRHLKNPI